MVRGIFFRGLVWLLVIGFGLFSCLDLFDLFSWFVLLFDGW